MIRAVIDTNVLVSGLLSPAGNEALIVLAVRQGLIRPCVSEAVLAEYAEVLARPKFAFPPHEVAAVQGMFCATGELVALGGAGPVLPDPDDAEFARCAVATAAGAGGGSGLGRRGRGGKVRGSLPWASR